MTNTVRFSDGSFAELSASDASVHVTQDMPTKIASELFGGAHFDVVPNPGRTFEVRSSDVRVRVLGTRFLVQQTSAGRVEVLVERGRVEVAWLGGSTVLGAGQGGVFPPTGTNEPAKSPEAHPVAAGATPNIVSAPGTPSDAARTTITNPRDEAARLMREADAARVEGRPTDAISLLRRVCDEYPADKHAPLAEFSLGRVLHDLGRNGEAVAAFHKARTMWPEGPLAGDAFAREAEDLQQSGQLTDAKQVAESYLALYPGGRHAAAMSKLLAP